MVRLREDFGYQVAYGALQRCQPGTLVCGWGRLAGHASPPRLPHFSLSRAYRANERLLEIRQQLKRPKGGTGQLRRFLEDLKAKRTRSCRGCTSGQGDCHLGWDRTLPMAILPKLYRLMCNDLTFRRCATVTDRAGQERSLPDHLVPCF